MSIKERTIELRQHIEALLREYPELAHDEFLRADMLEGETNITEVLIEVQRMVSDSMALRDGTDARLEELTTRRQRFERRIDFGRDLITAILMSADLKKVELPEFTASLRNGKPQLAMVADAAELPDELVKIKRTPDRTKIREWLEAGREVPGCALGNAMPSLTIRVR